MTSSPEVSLDSDAIRWFSHERRRRSARRWKWGALAAFLMTFGGVSTAGVFGWLAFGALIAAVVAWMLESRHTDIALTEGKSDPGTLSLDDGRLRVVSGEHDVTLDSSMVASGWVESSDHVILQLRDGRTLSVRIDDPKQQGDVLRALGVSAADRVLRVPIYSRLGSIPSGELAAAVIGVILLPVTVLAWGFTSASIWEILAGGITTGAFAALALSAVFMTLTTPFAWALLWAWKRRQVVVGTDGIVVEGARRKVIPFSEIENVRLESWGVSVDRKNGKTVRLPTGRTDAMYPTPASDAEKARARRLVERVREAKEASGQSRNIDQKAGWLASAERDLASWRAALEELGVRVGDYRRPGISNEELLEIARDAARPRDQRAAALFLIGRRKADVEAGRRIVEACADPKLAEALTRSLAGELTRDALAPEPPRARVRVAEELEPGGEELEEDEQREQEARERM